MDRMDNAFRNQIQAILRVLNVTSCLREDRVPCEIEQGLFLGSMGAASNKDALKSRNITHILTVANSLAPAYPNDFVYKIIGVADKEDTNLSQYFDECINFIDEAKRQGGGVLVHCFVGRSRSVTIVVAYLMKKPGMSLSQAMEHVKSRRPQAAPNSGFIMQLQDFEKSLQGHTEVASLLSPDRSHFLSELRNFGHHGFCLKEILIDHFFKFLRLWFPFFYKLMCMERLDVADAELSFWLEMNNQSKSQCKRTVSQLLLKR